MMFPEASWHWLSQSNNQKFLALVGAVAAAVLWLVHQRIPKNVHGPEHPDPAAGFNNLAKLFREKATGIERPNVTLVVNTNWIDGVPIPDDVKVSPAPQSASETQKRLLGAWAGTSDDSWRHILIVEDIRADGEARVVFASSNSSEWSREEGRLAGDTLSLDEGLVTYKLTATDRLLAEFECFTHVAQARMSRIELAALTRLGATIDWSDGVEFLDTDLTEDGKPVHLEAVLFKPKGSGPFPLLVFNHGRLCWGASRWLTRTETHLELAEFFLEKGWMVAFPQRRGRGKSDGLHGEGLDERGEALFVYDPGRSLSGAERALRDIEAAIAALQRRPDVAGKRLLIGGASGGGILSIAYAGLHPQQIAGVINFVGGWADERDRWASEINGGLFARGARYDRATLWLYGNRDSVFSIEHSRSNFETFSRAGGKGEFIEFWFPGEDGHNLSGYPDRWREHVEKYLETLEPVDRP